MRNFLFLLGLYVLMASCSVTHTSVANNQESNVLQNEFVLDESTLSLIEESLNSEGLKDFFHFELAERLPLKLVYKKKSNDKKFTILCFGNPVKVVKSDNIYKGHP